MRFFPHFYNHSVLAEFDLMSQRESEIVEELRDQESETESVGVIWRGTVL
jgi:hypothetical protein